MGINYRIILDNKGYILNNSKSNVLNFLKDKISTNNYISIKKDYNLFISNVHKLNESNDLYDSYFYKGCIESKKPIQIKKKLKNKLNNIFSSYTPNAMQSYLSTPLYYSDDNILISAPTGSGKSHSILYAILKHINSQIIYVAPLKALVREISQSLNKMFKNKDIIIRELSGDVDISMKDVINTNIIVCTPEKLDLLIRKGYNNFSLLVMDEIHLLNEERGAILESIISTVNYNGLARVIGLSASIPNLDQVAYLCRAKKENVFHFDDTFRSTSLDIELVFGKAISTINKKDIDIATGINDVVDNILLKINSCKKIGNQSIYSCNQTNKMLHKQTKTSIYSNENDSRINNGEEKEVFLKKIQNILQSNIKKLGDCKEGILLEKLSQNLDDLIIIFVSSRKETIILQKFLDNIFNATETLCIVGVHNGSMNRKQRISIEEGFKEGKIRILVSTSTLAWGVNLPADTVILYDVKNTTIDQHQMIGRAGRYKRGKAIIITKCNKDMNQIPDSNDILKCFLYNIKIESKLEELINEIVNSQIVLGRITLEELINWYKYTLHYIQYKNESIIENSLMLLENEGYIIKENDTFIPKYKSRITSYFYMKIDEMNTIEKQLTKYINEHEIIYILLVILDVIKENKTLKDVLQDDELRRNGIRITLAMFHIAIDKKYSRTAKSIYNIYQLLKLHYHPFTQPLWFYLFSSDKKHQNYYIDEIESNIQEPSNEEYTENELNYKNNDNLIENNTELSKNIKIDNRIEKNILIKTVKLIEQLKIPFNTLRNLSIDELKELSIDNIQEYILNIPKIDYKIEYYDNIHIDNSNIYIIKLFIDIPYTYHIFISNGLDRELIYYRRNKGYFNRTIELSNNKIYYLNIRLEDINIEERYIIQIDNNM
ncbi:DEAD/DEAH box helicase [Spraguea lophii 42_110]|uniref:DEAD/DEAH box helicase n=1 Tax=Spraguea lophii (strain 42_110) TaxID=1358809 RepID=S7XLS7_SPRLO|nr:DEAD/DEAH box helicase [Spraguea lophii 42_110]